LVAKPLKTPQKRRCRVPTLGGIVKEHSGYSLRYLSVFVREKFFPGAMTPVILGENVSGGSFRCLNVFTTGAAIVIAALAIRGPAPGGALVEFYDDTGAKGVVMTLVVPFKTLADFRNLVQWLEFDAERELRAYQETASKANLGRGMRARRSVFLVPDLTADWIALRQSWDECREEIEKLSGRETLPARI
jgi:hypothetical protein